jgi:hypothetical protein
MTDEHLDDPIFGAKRIGRAARIFERDKKTDEIKLDKDGRPVVDERKAFYLLETGAIAAKRVIGKKENKEGKKSARGQWCSSLRLIRASLLPESAG